jgi:F420-dependent oxidoreductase-like protein
MRIGLHIVRFDWPGHPACIGSTLAEIARTADEAGLYSLWVMDHFFQLGERYGLAHGPVEAPMLEGYSTIAYMAGVTQRINLGLLVTCNLFRQPGLLLKTITTIDVLSGGRTYMGLGAGWFEREAEGLGLPVPDWKERYERLEETLQILKCAWDGSASDFCGKHYDLKELLISPPPLSKPHPPILIGGEGEKKTLRLVAQYADASNFVFGSPLDDFGVLKLSYTDAFAFLQHKLDVLRRHCEDVGRPYDEIEKTVVTYILLAKDRQQPADIVELCKNLADMGFQHTIFIMPNVYEIEPLKVLGDEVIPRVADL